MQQGLGNSYGDGVNGLTVCIEEPIWNPAWNRRATRAWKRGLGSAVNGIYNRITSQAPPIYGFPE